MKILSISAECASHKELNAMEDNYKFFEKRNENVEVIDTAYTNDVI